MGSFRLWGALHRGGSHPSPVIYLVTTGIGTIAVNLGYKVLSHVLYRDL